jgi:guanylate kinase
MKSVGTLFIVIGPSRVGKNAILKCLMRRKSLGLRELVTVTTRERRVGEKEGKDYFFVSDDQFDKMIKQDEFIEWVNIQTHRSGTPKEPMMSWLKSGHNMVADLDVHGALDYQKDKRFNVVTIFILPGSLRDLRRRLHASIKNSHERKVRWETMKNELALQTKFDYRVVNVQGKLKQAVEEVVDIINAYINKA